MGLYHLYALYQEKAPELEAADKFLMIPDLFNYYLTGIAVNEYTDATMSLMVDQKNKRWQTEILKPLGIEERLFCPMVMPGNVMGCIQKSICDEFEIPPIPVVNVASHDTASAVAGVPLTRKGDDWAFISLGTWAIYGVETKDQYISEEVFRSGFANQGGCEGKTNFVNLFTGLWVIQQCYERWCKEAGEKIGWDRVIDEVVHAEGGKAFINLDSADFAQPNPNMPRQIMQYCNHTGQRVPEGMGEIARCVYESLVVKFVRCHADVKKFTGKDIKLLHLFGGGSKNKLLCQWTADALGVPVLAGPAETTSVGNLLIQMKGTGEIGSLEEGREISGRSASLQEYLPGKDREVWAGYYDRYTALSL
jgi:sugar (pentulose or hexulose) kinase